MHLSTLGLIHTVISVLALVFAVAEILRSGRIRPTSKTGQAYILTTAVGCLTAFGLSKHGGFNPGHALAIIALVCLLAAFLVEKKQIRGWIYFQTFALSFSFFISLIPATNETLSRLPVDAPLANGPQDPLVVKTLGIIFAIFVVGSLAQLWSLRKRSN